MTKKLKTAEKVNIGEKITKLVPKNLNSDFIPYVCHLNKNTVLTKEGNLLSVIKIPGFNNSPFSSNLVNIRESIRDSLRKNCKSLTFSFCFHIIRRKKDITNQNDKQDSRFFTRSLNKVWKKKNNLLNYYVNDFYITILKKGHYNISISSIKSLFNSLSFYNTKNLSRKKIEDATNELGVVVSKIAKDLLIYNPSILSIKESNNIVYSEITSFFYKLLCFGDKNIPLKINDLSEDLASRCKVSFGKDTIKIKDEDDNVKVATILSLKEYNKLSRNKVRELLNLQQEFIISQSVEIQPRDLVISKFEYQNYIWDVSEDKDLQHISGMRKLIDEGLNEIIDYSNQQTTISLISENGVNLSQNIKSILKTLSDLGIATVRENIFTEHCFWSTLPCNFRFLLRKVPAASIHFAEFFSLQDTTYSNLAFNSNFTAIFKSVLNTAYFFGFSNNKKVENLIVTGSSVIERTIMINFLAAKFLSLNNKVYYLDHEHCSEIFSDAISGSYFKVTNKKDVKRLKLNPFRLKNKNNVDFLILWFKYLVTSNTSIPEKEIDLIPYIIKKAVNNNVYKFASVAKLFDNKNTPTIHQQLSIWHSNGDLAFLFDNDEESDLQDNLANFFSLYFLIQEKNILFVFLIALFNKILDSLDQKTPSIFVINQMLKYMNKDLFFILEFYVKEFNKKNCSVVLLIKNNENNYRFVECFKKNLSIMFLPDNYNPDDMSRYYNLDKKQFEFLKILSYDENLFSIKSENGWSILNNDVINLGSGLKSVLYSDSILLRAIKLLKDKYGNKTKDWVPKFISFINNQ